MEGKPKLERLVSDTERSIHEKKEVVLQKIEKENDKIDAPESEKPKGGGLPPTEALKRFFDRIPLFSVPGIGNAGVVEVKMTDSIGAAIRHLYTQKVLGAPVRDPQKPSNSTLADRYVGLLDFASLVLWALEPSPDTIIASHASRRNCLASGDSPGLPSAMAEEFEHAEGQGKMSGMVLSPTDAPQNATSAVGAKELERTPGQVTQAAESTSQGDPSGRDGFFGLLDKLDDVKSTQVGAMARSFRWGPFLPVRPEDTLLHVLLLLSKHRLKAVPVVDVESDNPCVKGFITQDIAVQLLLQCEGLHWFDTIAAKSLSVAGFDGLQHAGQLVVAYGDDVLMAALGAMWKHRISGVPVLDRSSKSLIGNIRSADLRVILEKPHIFNHRRELLVGDFIEEDGGNKAAEATPLQEDFGAAISAAALSLGNITKPSMREPAVSRLSDTLKATMQKLCHARSDRSFLVDDAGAVTGVVTLRDIIMQFSPPLAEAPRMGGFFESALQQTGAHMGPGSVVTVGQSK